LTLCPPTFKKLEQLHTAAHTTCDKMSNQWTSNKNSTNMWAQRCRRIAECMAPHTTCYTVLLQFI